MAAESPAAAAAQPAPVAGGSKTADLEQFMVNFVVEQTGYPPEVVELDADLEADLGIDSIKKAQLFGELQEYFDVEPSEDLTLDQFPTLRHIVRFLDQATSGASDVPPLDAVTSEFASAATDGDVSAADPFARSPSASPEPAPTAAASASGNRTADLEQFMVNFVVEQTGYPPEVVELDADLEADLGIDSIKKAQLFGELQEYFDVEPGEDLTLDQFPTLRHIVRFLDQATGGPSPPESPRQPVLQPAVGETSVHPTAGLGAIDSVERSGHFPTPLHDPVSTAVPLECSITGSVATTDRRTIALQRVLRRFADCAEERSGRAEVSAAALIAQLTPAARAELERLADEASVPIENVVALAEALSPEMTAPDAQAAFAVATNPFGVATHAVATRLPLSGRLAASVEAQITTWGPGQGVAGAMVGIAGLPGGTCGINARGISMTMGSTAADLPAAASVLRSLELRMAVPQVLATANDLQAAVDRLQSYIWLGPWTAWLGQLREGAAYRVDCDGTTLTLVDEDEAVVTAEMQSKLTASTPTHLRFLIQPGTDTLAVDGGQTSPIAPQQVPSFDLRCLTQTSGDEIAPTRAGRLTDASRGRRDASSGRRADGHRISAITCASGTGWNWRSCDYPATRRPCLCRREQC